MQLIVPAATPKDAFGRELGIGEAMVETTSAAGTGSALDTSFLGGRRELASFPKPECFPGISSKK
jgi:hypothetical protein